jgi:hypothetical protein
MVWPNTEHTNVTGVFMNKLPMQLSTFVIYVSSNFVHYLTPRALYKRLYYEEISNAHTNDYSYAKNP